MLSCAGATNGSVLPCARITFAMAEEGNFFRWPGRVHPRFLTPANSLWLQGVWTCLLILIGSFDMLTDMFVFITWCFYGFAAYGIFIIRRKIPDAERPYKMWGYPWLPLVFITFSAIYVGLTLWSDISAYASGESPVIKSVFGLALTALGVPLYWYLTRKHSATEP
jgi:APA family basic amino acid/polyamine antiporter